MKTKQKGRETSEKREDHVKRKAMHKKPLFVTPTPTPNP